MDAIIGAKTPPGLEDEFVVVQGVADLVVLLPGEIWLVDFKTDEIKSEELTERRRLYEPQLKLYAAALSRIYSRPVDKLLAAFSHRAENDNPLTLGTARRLCAKINPARRVAVHLPRFP